MPRLPISRHASGRGFSYRAADELITDHATLTWIKSLAIPPAWTSVTISRHPGAKVLAKGRDTAGRLQAIYNPVFRSHQDVKKFSHILAFARQLPVLRRQVEHDLAKHYLPKDKVLACVVKLIDIGYFRVGNEQYAKEHHHYGITTMRSKHVDITRYTVTFDFIGKSGKRHIKTVADRTLSRIIKQLDEMPGYELFRYYDETGALHDVLASDVNDYIKLHLGEEFSAKDFRTWGGTLLAVELLSAAEIPATPRDRQKAITACVQRVATRLGNTPAIARASYIDPAILHRYTAGEDFNKVRQSLSSLKQEAYMTNDELCALKIIEAKPR